MRTSSFRAHKRPMIPSLVLFSIYLLECCTSLWAADFQPIHSWEADGKSSRGCTRLNHPRRIFQTQSLSRPSLQLLSDRPMIGGAIVGSAAEELLSAPPPSMRKKSQLRLTPGIWPCGDSLDTRLISIALPTIGMYAIGPLVGAVDLFWINQMGDTLALAGQAAADQVFNSMFWFTAFLPAVTATLVSKENATGNQQGIQDAVNQSFLVSFALAAVTTGILLWNPERVLSSVLKDGSTALPYARSYLVIRAFAFLPSLISLVGFSAFRGTLDTVTPVKISLLANVFHAVLVPVLVFSLSMGVRGAALATLTADIASAAAYIFIMKKRAMISGIQKLFQLPTWRKLEPLIKGGAALQIRTVALNLTLLAVARVVQSIDRTGVAAAAHALALQTFQVGGIFFLALSTVAQTMVPNDLYEGGKQRARATVDRILSWSFLLGISFCILQLALLPLILRSSPLQEVREAATGPSIVASIFQVVNGLVFVGEGVMIGTGSYLHLSVSTALATVGCLLALRRFPARYGLTGVWFGFAVFNSFRLMGVLLHHYMIGPLAPRNMKNKHIRR